MNYYLIFGCIFTMIFSSINVCHSQDCKEFIGEYYFKNGDFYEEISLKKDGQFSYMCTGHFTKEQIVGNWQIRGQQLILDSRPQRDRLIVRESFKRGIKGKRIFVRDKANEYLNYTIIGINAINDTVFIRDQWKSSILDHNVNSFYLIDNKGLFSPVYLIKGLRSNVFEVFFETKRIFEDEHWDIQTDNIVPKSAGGKLQGYSLIKRK